MTQERGKKIEQGENLTKSFRFTTDLNYSKHFSNKQNLLFFWQAKNEMETDLEVRSFENDT